MNKKGVEIILWFVISGFSIVQTMTERCVTPNNSTGRCVPIETCPEMMTMLKALPLTREVSDHLRAAHCGFHGPKTPKVCCDFNALYATTPRIALSRSAHNPESMQASVAEKDRLKSILSELLPDKHECGRSPAISRIFHGVAVGVFDFPWMALIEYETLDGNTFLCGGSLISKRYVLTAAHCVNEDDIPPDSKVVSVRLGEHDLSTDKDCDEDFVKVCSDDPIDVPIDEIIMHERYNSRDNNHYHDIALLKLTRDVDFTDFIKPICLPYAPGFISQSFAGTNGTVAGWGKTEYDSSGSTVKLAVVLPVKSHEECAQIYEKTIRLGEGQICAGGEKNKDSCEGDSGGPLMNLHQESDTWYITGIISFGSEKCGSEGWPGIYTRVTQYVPWIIRKFVNL